MTAWHSAFKSQPSGSHLPHPKFRFYPSRLLLKSLIDPQLPAKAQTSTFPLFFTLLVFFGSLVFSFLHHHRPPFPTSELTINVVLFWWGTNGIPAATEIAEVRAEACIRACTPRSGGGTLAILDTQILYTHRGFILTIEKDRGTVDEQVLSSTASSETFAL